MASDTSIKSNDPDRAGPARARTGGLTLRILAVNIVAPLVLVLGLLYMGQYRDSLISAELETLRAQARLFAGALAEGAVRLDQKAGQSFPDANDSGAHELLMPELSRRMIRRLGQSTNYRVRLFSTDGDLIGDSHQLSGPGDMVQIMALAPPPEKPRAAAILAYLGTKALELLPTKNSLRPYFSGASSEINDYPDARVALMGQSRATAWQTRDGKIILTAAAPVQKTENVKGVVVLTKDGNEIELAMTKVRFDVLTVFLGALSITIFLSIYLSGIIGRPLKRLAHAAEAVRQSKDRNITIPDLSARNDEIGELSMALRDMTQALWDRMDTIERFAADVAHEIKNPLTSLRSAVETASKVKSKKDQDKLMAIIQHDVQRLDRLISDISNASRLDAELSREKMSRVDLRALLTQLADARKQPLERGGGDTGADSAGIVLNIPGRKHIYVRGNESRLAQVFDNLISNALSFSPPDGTVNISVIQLKGQVTIQVEDEGPGIPENKLETIFERFYSERPQHEDYGAHSGLGLSIARQIINAHNGRIYAENIHDDGGKVVGACFTVILDSIEK